MNADRRLKPSGYKVKALWAETKRHQYFLGRMLNPKTGPEALTSCSRAVYDPVDGEG
jgi:hypothetical protein